MNFSKKLTAVFFDMGRASSSRLLFIVAIWLAATVSWPTNANTNPPVILLLGDSLSAEYGLARGTGWAAHLQQKLKQQGLPHQLINASISGETTSGGAARINALLSQHRPKILIIALGANDALRGLALSASAKNLQQISRAGQAVGAKILLVGMALPPNYGPVYSKDFQQMFSQIATAEKISLLPFLLAGFAQDLNAFQADRIHPNQAAQSKILANVWPSLTPLLTQPSKK